MPAATVCLKRRPSMAGRLRSRQPCGSPASDGCDCWMMSAFLMRGYARLHGCESLCELRQVLPVRLQHLVEQGLRLVEIEVRLRVRIEQEGMQRCRAVARERGPDDLLLEADVVAEVSRQRLR